MGNLSHLTGKMDKIKQRIDTADNIGLDLSEILGKGFGKVNANLEANLKTLVEQSSQSQNAAFQAAVAKAVEGVSQTHSIVLNSTMTLARELLKLKEELSKEVSEVSTGVGSSSETLSQEIQGIAKSVQLLPTTHPDPVDLSGLMKGISNLDTKVKGIPTSIPVAKEISLTPIEKRLAMVETALKKRVHVFEITRKNDQITKVTVRTK